MLKDVSLKVWTEEWLKQWVKITSDLFSEMDQLAELTPFLKEFGEDKPGYKVAPGGTTLTYPALSLAQLCSALSLWRSFVSGAASILLLSFVSGAGWCSDTVLSTPCHWAFESASRAGAP